MKKLIFKKIIKDIFYFFLLISLSITLIVWVIQAVNFLDIVSEDGHGFDIYFKYTLLHVPKIFNKIFLFIFFISVFYIILKFENNNELLIFWTNGIKRNSFIKVIIIYSFIFMIVQMLFSSFLVPQSQNKAREFIRVSKIELFSALIKEKKFIDTVSNLTIFIEDKKTDGTLTRIFLKEDFQENKSQIIYASSGELKTYTNNKTYLKLYNGKVINTDKGKINTFSFTETEIDLSRYKTKTTTNPKLQELKSKYLIDCLISINANKEHLFETQYFQCEKNNFSEIARELFRRLYVPIYIPLLGLIASLLIFKSKDSFNYNFFKNSIFIFGVLTIVSSELTVRYFGSNFINNIFLILLPLIIFLIIILWLLSNSNYVKNK
ncbi:LptF/LptG family permease [Candidatus Pelagibacter sp.]|nr:LptF/LptG family permease [Candidatus Pelagibacter sp.]